MTSKTDHQLMSNLELLMLARLACATGANEDELAAALTEVAPPDGPRTAREHIVEALTALRRRPPRRPRAARRRPRPRGEGGGGAGGGPGVGGGGGGGGGEGGRCVGG